MLISLTKKQPNNQTLELHMSERTIDREGQRYYHD